VKPSNGAAPEELFYGAKALFKDARDWSPDGKAVVFEELDPQTNRDIWILPMEGDRTPKPYLRTPFNEYAASISPDGRWLAYISDESGGPEVYVDSFPTPRNKYRVTDRGALAPYWSRSGKELAIVSADARSVLVSNVTTGAEFHADPPRQMIALPKGTVFARPTPDLQRVLVSKPVNESTTSTLTLVFDWLGALRK
jgi:dipeptidyl aminopeptidase/acylaminoacyl peptidase